MQTNPPKPTRVVADSFSSPMTHKRKMIETPSKLDLDDELDEKRRRRENDEAKARRRKIRIDDLLEDIKMEIVSFLVFGEEGSIEGLWAASKLWNQLCTSSRLWRRFPTFHPSGAIRNASFQYLGLKNQGTEGSCYKVLHRRSGRLFAMKRARVYPTGEGVPYYMLRELAFLQGLRHPHIATVERISLVDNKLFLFFGYMEKSLFDLINPNNDADGGKPLPPTLIRRFLYQILQGVAFCHQRGVLHRNLKPKHLLVDIPRVANSSRRCVSVREERDSLSYILGLTDQRPPRCQELDNKPDETGGAEKAMDPAVYERMLEAAEEGHIRISDFALVRSTSIPLRNYTTEVVTLWYRSPEVLMGGRYFAAVDVWSVGCVFAEMILGKPLFPGICEIDQLFQIFLKLGTPTNSSWPGFSSLPNYQTEFPRWPRRSLQVHVPDLDKDGVDLMTKMLDVNPNTRITAEDALRHAYFDPIRPASKAEVGGEQAQQIVKGSSVTPVLPSSSSSASTSFSSSSSSSSSSSPAATPSLDAEFGNDNEFPGRVDLNSLSWHNDGDEVTKSTCWKYSARIDELASHTSAGRQGLGDINYLIRYYHYLKALEAQMFPLVDYLAGADSERAPSATSFDLRTVMPTTTTQAPAGALGNVVDNQTPIGLAHQQGAGRNLDAGNNGTAGQPVNNLNRERAIVVTLGAAAADAAPTTVLPPQNNTVVPTPALPAPALVPAPFPTPVPADNNHGGPFSRTLNERQDPAAGNVQSQSELQPLHRSMLVDWLVEVIDVFDMSLRSVFMAVNYTDRYLAQKRVQRNRFQLLGATCLHVASKCEDVSYIGVEDLVVCADKVYQAEDVLRLEEDVLNTLDFHMSVPTVIDFLNVFVVRIKYDPEEDRHCTVLSEEDRRCGKESLPNMTVSEETKALAQYLCELSLQEHFFIPQMPSCVAAAALTYALFLKEAPISQERMEAVTGYPLKLLQPCIERMNGSLQDAPLSPNLHVIYRRYQRPQNFAVANTTQRRPLYTLFE